MGNNIGGKAAGIALLALAGGDVVRAKALWQELAHTYPAGVEDAIDNAAAALAVSQGPQGDECPGVLRLHLRTIHCSAGAGHRILQIQSAKEAGGFDHGNQAEGVYWRGHGLQRELYQLPMQKIPEQPAYADPTDVLIEMAAQQNAERQEQKPGTLLQRMAEEPCESFTGPRFGGAGTCMSEGSGKTPDAPYLADRYCPPCRLRAALAEEKARSRNAYAEGYADGYASAQRGDPPYVEPSAVEDLPEIEYAIRTYYSAEGTPTFYPMASKEEAETWVRPWKDRTPWSQHPVERRVGGWNRIPRRDELNQVELEPDDA